MESSCTNGQFLRQWGKVDFSSDSMERSFNLLLQEISGEFSDITIRGALPGGGAGQPDLLDCVDPMAWDVGHTGA